MGLDIRSVPKVGPSLQKPFSQYLEAQRNKLHHAGGSAPAVRTIHYLTISKELALLMFYLFVKVNNYVIYVRFKSCTGKV